MITYQRNDPRPLPTIITHRVVRDGKVVTRQQIIAPRDAEGRKLKWAAPYDDSFAKKCGKGRRYGRA